MIGSTEKEKEFIWRVHLDENKLKTYLGARVSKFVKDEEQIKKIIENYCSTKNTVMIDKKE